VPRLAEATVDARTVGVALAVALSTGLLFGLLPALRAARPDAAELVKEAGRGGGAGPARQRVRASLVVAEVALSFAILIGAGLLLRSLDRLLAVDKGFDAERVVSGSLQLPASRYPDAATQAAFFTELDERVGALPGVAAAAFVNNVPLDGGVNGSITIEGREFPPDQPPYAEKRIVSPEVFAVLGTPLYAGRAFDARDIAGAPPVVIVNRAFAERYFPGESALGKRVDFEWGTDGLQEIVGVAGDVREQALHLPAGPTIYIPLAQRSTDHAYLIVRTMGDPHALAPALRRAVRALDADLPLDDVRTLADVVADGLVDRRLAMSLFGVFSLVSLLLAALGLYAVISYTVLLERREIGIRMALGARAEQVVRAVVGRGLLLAAIGVAVGALAALTFGRFLSTLLYGVESTDPATFAGVALVLGSIALLATAVPALRAARIDPATVLRSE
jgi:predicted permease